MWGRTKEMVLTVFVLLLLTLTGCGDGDGYATYHAVLDAATGGGSEDLVAMTQKPESPAPRSDQEDCPTVMVLLMLLGGLYAWHLTRIQKYSRIWVGCGRPKGSK